MKPKIVAGVLVALLFVVVCWVFFPSIIENAITGVAK